MRVLLIVLLLLASPVYSQQASTAIPDSDEGFSWKSGGAWYVHLGVSPYVCDLLTDSNAELNNETRKDPPDYQVHIKVDNKGYSLWIISLGKERVSSPEIRLLIDGQPLASLAMAQQYNTKTNFYTTHVPLPASEVIKILNAMMRGGFLTIDAGQPIGISLVKADQAIINLSACVVKGRQMGGVFNY